MHGHDRHNTTIFSVILNMSTTCFGQYCFWQSSGRIQLSEKTTQYNMIQYNHQCWWVYSIIISVDYYTVSYYIVSTTYFGQYYFWPSSGWIQLPEKTAQYNMIQYNHQHWLLHCIIFYCVVFSGNCTQPHDGQKQYWPKHVVDMLRIIEKIVVLWRSCPCIIVSLCSTVHIYTQTIHRTTQLTTHRTTKLTTNWEECGPCPVFASYTLAFALHLRKKHGKTSVRVVKPQSG